MDDQVEDLQAAYRQRVEKYRYFGCDIEGERRFIIEKAYPISGRMLEIGTGKGYLTLALAKRKFCFVSVDISAEEQKIARLALESLGLEKNVDFQVADAEKLNFKNKSFDVIISANVIHHFLNPYAVVDELMRLVSLTGKVVLSDFTEQGFMLVDKIHQQEGKRHSVGNVGLQQIIEYLSDKKYFVDKFQNKFQEGIIICHQ